jgi:hypothetical protein
MTTEAPTATATPTAGGGSVCVASAIGHRFDIQTIGLTVFGNSLQSTPIDSWGIDDLALSKVASLLPGMTVRRMYLSRPALLAYEARQTGDIFTRNRGAEFMTALRAAALTVPKCDFYLAVVRYDGQYAGTNQTISGLGVLKHDVTIVSRTIVFAVITPMLYDRNFNSIRMPFSANDFGNAMAAGLTGESPNEQQIDSSNWPATPQAAVQSAILRDTTKLLVDRILTSARRASSTSEIPAAGASPAPAPVPALVPALARRARAPRARRPRGGA